MVDNGRNAASLKPISPQSSFKWVNEIAPVIFRAQQQNNLRLEAMEDAYSPISHVAVVLKLLGISPENRTAASPGFLQERLALKSNAGRTAKGSKQRAIKQIYVTSANGFLLCGIMIIRNRKFKRIMVKTVGAPTTIGHEYWLILEPVGINASTAVAEFVRRSNSGISNGSEEDMVDQGT